MGRFIQYRTRDSLYDGAFDSKVGWTSAGLGNLVVTDNGRLIVIDGGKANDAEDLLELIASQSSDKIPQVDLWIITHAHHDHYGAVRKICAEQAMASRISVKRFVWWFPDEFCDKNGTPDSLSYGNDDMQRICAVMGAEAHRPTRDEVITIDDVELRFLYVPDDCSIINTAGGNPNLCSLIFTVSGNGRRVMVTGDAYGRTMKVTAWRYAKALKCDALQMPHHFCCDAYGEDFYRLVDPKIVLIPASVAGYRAMHTEYANTEGGRTNLRVEERAEQVYRAFEGTAAIEI